MFKAVDHSKTEDWTHPGDKDPKTIFKIGSIPGRVMDRIFDDLASSDGLKFAAQAVEAQKEGKIQEQQNADDHQDDEDDAEKKGAKSFMMAMKPFKLLREFVKWGLKGIVNPKDPETGKALPDGIDFRTSNENVGGRTFACVSEQTLDAMPRKLITGLGTKIMAVNTMDEVDKGN